jgi:hypothetical protein
MYGLGIRIGVYCQALVGAVASGFYQDSADGMQWANGYFRCAFFIALFYLTSTNKEFQAVEAAIVVLLGLICVLYNLDNHWDYNQTFIKKTYPVGSLSNDSDRAFPIFHMVKVLLSRKAI